MVLGRVQGVYYRANVKKQADLLGLKGWVRNLDNGCVELIAQGKEEDIEKLHRWLWQGPVLAKVENVQLEIVQIQEFKDFTVLK